jgi:Uma2 family endonuclease
VALSRLEPLTAEQWERFIPLCPDFVLELRSPADRLDVLQRKMEEYVENGARLGWLVDPLQRRVHVYRGGERPQTLDGPEKLSGEPVLSGFVLDLVEVWR